MTSTLTGDVAFTHGPGPGHNDLALSLLAPPYNADVGIASKGGAYPAHIAASHGMPDVLVRGCLCLCRVCPVSECICSSWHPVSFECVPVVIVRVPHQCVFAAVIPCHLSVSLLSLCASRARCVCSSLLWFAATFLCAPVADRTRCVLGQKALVARDSAVLTQAHRESTDSVLMTAVEAAQVGDVLCHKNNSVCHKTIGPRHESTVMFLKQINFRSGIVSVLVLTRCPQFYAYCPRYIDHAHVVSILV